MNYMENMPIQPNMIMPFNNQNIINELLYKLNEMDNKIKKLEQRINDKVSKYSLGMRQRLRNCTSTTS